METTEQQTTERLADDLLVGASAIAAELGIKQDAVYYLFRQKLLPIGKMGKHLISSRRKLRRATQTLTG